MALIEINLGKPNDGNGDTIQDFCNTVNHNFSELFNRFGIEHKTLTWNNLSETRDFFNGVVERFEALDQIANFIKEQ